MVNTTFNTQNDKEMVNEMNRKINAYIKTALHARDFEQTLGARAHKNGRLRVLLESPVLMHSCRCRPDVMARAYGA